MTTLVFFCVLSLHVIPNVYTIYCLYIIANILYQNSPVSVCVRMFVHVFILVCYVSTPLLLFHNNGKLQLAICFLIHWTSAMRNYFLYVFLQLGKTFVFLVAFFSLYIGVNPGNSQMFFSFAYCMSITAVQITLFQFVNIPLLIKQTFCYIKSKLSNLGVSRSKLFDFQRLQKLHSTTFDIFEIICSIYSPFLLVLLLQLLLWVLHMLYFCILKIMGYKIAEHVLFVLICLLYVVYKLLMIAHSCRGAELEVSINNTREISQLCKRTRFTVQYNR